MAMLIDNHHHFALLEPDPLPVPHVFCYRLLGLDAEIRAPKASCQRTGRGPGSQNATYSQGPYTGGYQRKHSHASDGTYRGAHGDTQFQLVRHLNLDVLLENDVTRLVHGHPEMLFRQSRAPQIFDS